MVIKHGWRHISIIQNKCKITRICPEESVALPNQYETIERNDGLRTFESGRQNSNCSVMKASLSLDISDIIRRDF